MDPVTVLGIVQTLRGASKKKGLIPMIGVKNSLSLIGLGVVVFVSAGYYLGWYQVSQQAGNDGQNHVKIQVNPARITEDLAKGKEKVLMVLDQNKGTITQVSGDAAAQVQQNGPTKAYSIPFVPRSTAEIHVPVQQPQQQIQFPTLPPAPPQPRQQEPVDFWILPR